jgi:hypothetical protein
MSHNGSNDQYPRAEIPQVFVVLRVLLLDLFADVQSVSRWPKSGRSHMGRMPRMSEDSEQNHAGFKWSNCIFLPHLLQLDGFAHVQSVFRGPKSGRSHMSRTAADERGVRAESCRFQLHPPAAFAAVGWIWLSCKTKKQQNAHGPDCCG